MVKKSLFIYFPALLMTVPFLGSCGGGDDIEDVTVIGPSDSGQGNQGGQNNSGSDSGNGGSSGLHDIRFENGEACNTNSLNKLAGSWYYLNYYTWSNNDVSYSHELYRFDKSMHYERYNVSLGTNKYDRHYEGSYSFDDEYIYFTNEDGGDTFKRKWKWISQNVIEIAGIKYYATSLQDLNTISIPLKDEAGVRVQRTFENNGDLTVTLIPVWGISKFYYTLSESKDANPSVSASSPKVMTYSQLKPGVTYYLRTYGVEKNGVAHVIHTLPIKNLGTIGVKNRMVYLGLNYDLVSAVMSQTHAAGTSNRNWKKLVFSDNDGHELVFMYTNPYYEGISKEWAEGTYKITTSNDCYQYNAFFRGKGNAEGAALKGKLKIKKTSSNYYVFDFDLDVLRGHFEGSVQK